MPTSTAPTTDAAPAVVPMLTGRSGPARLNVIATGVPVIDKLGEAYEDAFHEFQTVAAELREALDRKSLAGAQAADAAATARAIEAGEDDPGQPSVDALSRSIADLTRRRSAYLLVVDRRAREYVAGIAEHRAKAEDRLQRELAEARPAIAATVAELDAGLARLAELRARAAWLANGPRGKDRSRSAPTVEVAGNRMTVAELVGALAAAIDRPTVLERTVGHLEPAETTRRRRPKSPDNGPEDAA